MSAWEDKTKKFIEFLEQQKNQAIVQCQPVFKSTGIEQLFMVGEIAEGLKLVHMMQESPDEYASMKALEELNTVSRLFGELCDSIQNLAIREHVADAVKEFNMAVEQIRATITGTLIEAAKEAGNEALVQELQQQRAQMLSDVYKHYSNT